MTKSKILIYQKPKHIVNTTTELFDLMKSGKVKRGDNILFDDIGNIPKNGVYAIAQDAAWPDLIKKIIDKNRGVLDKLSGHTEPDELEFQIYAAGKELFI